MGIITTIIQYIGVTAFKIIIFLFLMWLAYKWANGGFIKAEKLLKKIKKTYGIGTILLLIVWWILTPSGGTPDDLISLWIIDTIGIIPYIIACGVLTAYLLWRMKITIVIYSPKGTKR